MDSGQVYGMLVGAGGVIATLAGTVYQIQRGIIAAQKEEIAALRREAKEAVAAKDTEIAELRRIAREKKQESAP